MEKGIVQHFDSRDNKRFGFIKPDAGGEDIWFHFNDGVRFERCGEGVRPSAKPLQWLPKKGEAVVFERTVGSDGRPKASPWGFESQHWGEMRVAGCRASQDDPFTRYPWLEGMFRFTGFDLTIADHVKNGTRILQTNVVKHLEIHSIALPMEIFHGKVRELMRSRKLTDCAVLDKGGVEIKRFGYVLTDNGEEYIADSYCESVESAAYLVLSRVINGETVVIYEITT